MKPLTTCMAVAITTIACLASSAQAAGINERQAAQRDSIRAGIADGSLTRREAGRLRDGQVAMERKEQRFRSDGELTRRERANLQATADANRASIYRQRHDAQVRNVSE